MDAFYLIWNPQGRAPTVKHLSFESAKREADRLSMNNPGESFVILQSMGEVKMVTTEFTPHNCGDGTIPF